MAGYALVTVMRCPVCSNKQAISGSMSSGTLVVCASCHSHLQITAQVPRRLVAVERALTRDAESQPESYA